MILLSLSNGRILARADYAAKDALKAVPGARWAPEAHVWHYPATASAAAALCALPGARPQDDVRQLANSIAQARTILNADELPPIPLTKTAPWRHQLLAYHWAKSLPACYLAMKMRTGKSKVVVDLAVNLGWRRILIVCPKSVVPVWPEQFALHGGAYVQVLALDEGSSASRRQRAEHAWGGSHPLAIVVNYQCLIAADFRKWAAKQVWDVIVVDEGHHAKAAGGVLSRFLALIGPHATRRIMLSGTPMAHSPLDLYGQYRFLDPAVFGTSYAAFEQRYAVKGGYMGHEVKGYQNMDEFQRKMGSIMLQVGDEVLDLPERQHIVRTAQLSPKARTIYDALEKDFVAELESGEITVANALVKLLRLSELTGGTLRPDDGEAEIVDTGKENLLAELLEDIAEPVVVFARFRADLDAVHRAAKAAGHASLELSGRDHAGLRRWQDGEGTVLTVQIQAGSEGISLARASLVVYYSVGFSLGEYEQSLSRPLAGGKKQPVTYYHLEMADTIDQKIYRALQDRKDVVEDVMAGMKAAA